MPKTKFTPVKDLSDPHIPQRLVEFVKYLNEVLKINPKIVTPLLDNEILVTVTQAEAFEKVVPHMVFRTKKKDLVLALSPLGLLTGFTNSENYRIFASFENDDFPYGDIIGFGVFHVTEVDDG